MPYAPGIQSDWSALSAGIARFGQNVKGFAEKRKAESQEAGTLRKLMSIYEPEQKESFVTMGLKDLRSAAAAYGANQAKVQQELRTRAAIAQLSNLEADNQRADQYLGLAKDQFTAGANKVERERADTDALRQAATGFAKDYSTGAPMVLRPDLLEKFQGPSGKLDWAMSRNPAAIRDTGVQHFIQSMARTDGQQSWEPRIRTLQDPGGRSVSVVQTGPNSSQILPPEDLSPAQKAQQIRSLRATQRQYLSQLSNPLADDVMKPALREHINLISQEIEELGGKRATDLNGGEAAPSAPKDAVRMIDPSGNIVLVPTAKTKELLTRGYKEAR